MNAFTIVLIVAAAIAAGIAGVAVQLCAMAKRKAALRQWAAARGLEFYDEQDCSMDSRYPKFACLNSGSLRRELANTEDRIQRARRFYNANVRDLNTRIDVVPANIVARWFGFQKRELFEVEDAIVRQTPVVAFESSGK